MSDDSVHISPELYISLAEMLAKADAPRGPKYTPPKKKRKKGGRK
jgi:hypothetical protein